MEKKSVKIIMPLFVTTGVNKRVKRIINLNLYRNWHRFTESAVKKEYAKIAVEKLEGLKFKTPIKLEFIYFKPTARRSDRANVLGIHEKYFCDSLVEANCIEDDNDDFIFSSNYSGGLKDKNNPRVEIIITEC